jgi:hypothetical protein
MKHVKLFENFIAESEEYAVVLTGGSIGDKPRPRNAKGYEGMDAGKEDLYTLDKAKEKAKRMNTQVLTPGERSHYGLKYIVVPVKAGKFIAESTEPNEFESLGITINEAADLKSVSDIVKREEHWSDRDFWIEILKGGVIRIAPKHSMRLRTNTLDLLGAHFDIKSSSESLDDERMDFWEYFLKPKGVKSKSWDGLDEATNESSTWEN